MIDTLRPRTRSAWVVLLGLLLGLVSAGVVLLDSGEASAGVAVACGDTITSDITLAADLLDCPNNGIIIGADDITLDLNGHTIDGDGELFETCSEGDFCDTGVGNDGHGGVRVINGSVTGFDVGVFIYSAARDRIVNVSSSTNSSFGFVLVESTRIVVRNSSGSDNIPPDGDGLSLFGSDHVRIVGNTFARNGLGMHVSDSSDNVFRGNVIARTQDSLGMLVEGDRNQIRGNVCRRNGICVLIGQGDGNVVARNRVRGGQDGFAVENGSDNLLVENRIVETSGSGIYLGLISPPIGGSGNVLRGNVVIDSGGDAFKVRGKADQSILAQNVARSAGDDGFSIQSPTSKVADNRAINNGDLGIRAANGTIDGGGNVARRNGNRSQCVNVSCS